tara:strand:+ start:459 stop:698 length:240 start_codon:yes stop_codon:yes gene_type:complete
MAKYTDEFIIKIKKDAESMTVKEIAEKHHMTTGKIKYIIYRAKPKVSSEEISKKERRDIIFGLDRKKKRKRTFLEWLFG